MALGGADFCAATTIPGKVFGGEHHLLERIELPTGVLATPLSHKPRYLCFQFKMTSKPPLTRSNAFVSALAAFASLGFVACQSGPVAEDLRAVESKSARVDEPMFAGPGTAYEAAVLITLPKTSPENHPPLHNVFELSENIISGGEPENEEAFRILQEKGVRTILSVDGKVPDAELAAKYGLKYVHVPIQYKGITEAEVAKITKTFREQEGPFYVHCYHGKHRGPAAAAIGRLALDGIPREEAIAEMRQWCGTSSSYEGLYATVAFGDIPPEYQTRAMDWDFPAANELEGIAGAMVHISRAHDAVKAASKNSWQPNPNHPDLNALNEAVKLADLFKRAQDLKDVASEPEDFRQWMLDSMDQAANLRDTIRAMEAGTASMEQANAAYKKLAATCSACHEKYRN